MCKIQNVATIADMVDEGLGILSVLGGFLGGWPPAVVTTETLVSHPLVLRVARLILWFLRLTFSRVFLLSRRRFVYPKTVRVHSQYGYKGWDVADGDLDGVNASLSSRREL